MRARDLNWLQVEEYLGRDDRVVLPLGSTEQHGYLSLETDNILAERVSAEAAEPLGVLVLPVLAYGLTPSFAAYPGSPTLRLETFLAVLRDLLDSLHGQGFRRFLLVNGHGGNVAGGSLVREWAAVHPDAQGIFHSWWSSERVVAAAKEIDPEPSHANWFENFPWTRLGRRRPAARAQAAARRSGLPRRLARPGARNAGRRGLRGRLRAAGRAGRGGLAHGRRRGPRAARERMAVDPLAVFHEWFEEARAAGVEAPEVMTLATADAEGRPSARMLLLKSADERGFTFFTGYESRKGRELAENPRAALVFYWRPLGRQVRVEGSVRRLSAEESDAYWATRPPRSQAAAAASRQGEPIESRQALEAEFAAQLALDEVRRPERWGGYMLEPDAIELWQHRDNRLHERIRFTRAREGWLSELLAP